MRRAAVRDDRQHLAVGDDPPFAGDDVHHAAPGRGALLLRRRDAEGLRVRAARRHHLGRVLVDLHRGAAAHDAGRSASPSTPGARDRRRPRARPATACSPRPSRQPLDERDAGARRSTPSSRVSRSAPTVRSTTPPSARAGASAAARVRMDAPGNGPPERDALERILALLGPRLDDARGRCSTMRPRAGAATPLGWARERAGACARSRASSGSSPATTGTSSSSGSRSSSTGCGSSRTPRHATDVRNACYRDQYGARIGRVPVRSRLLPTDTGSRRPKELRQADRFSFARRVRGRLRSAREPRHRHAVPDPGPRHPRGASRRRRPREEPDRLGQDARVRDPDRPARSTRPTAGPPRSCSCRRASSRAGDRGVRAGRRPADQGRRPSTAACR